MGVRNKCCYMNFNISQTLFTPVCPARNLYVDFGIHNRIHFLHVLHECFFIVGFSDPYCMLGIQPASLPASPRASEDEGRKHGFRLSFKRREGRQQRDSLGRLPARYIRATSVRPHTLSPKWNETFKL